jgi:hypothetical protein
MDQGDQIGRIIGSWVIVFFGQSFEYYENWPKFWIRFYINFDKICLGLHWAIFSQTPLVTLDWMLYLKSPFSKGLFTRTLIFVLLHVARHRETLS